jgi:hypothetical protein
MDAGLHREQDASPSFGSAEFTAGSQFRMGRAFTFVPLVSLLGLILAINIYRPLDTAPFYWIGLLVWFLSVFLISHVQKKAKNEEDVSSFFPTTTWIAWVPAFLAAVLLANGAMDRLPIDQHEEVVTRKTIHHGKGTSYYIEFSSWRPDRGFEKVPVSAQTYSEFQVNDRIVVDIHRGALHIPWMGTLHRAK